MLLVLGVQPVAASECVVLLHGLARSASSMVTLEQRLSIEGYHTANIDYPSRSHPVADLIELSVGEGIRRCLVLSPSRIHFVTHSLGGILVRFYLRENALDRLGRVVMLGPPNQGSEVVDALKNIPGYALINGPAGEQLGTGKSDLPRSLGPVGFELGVIAGTESFNPLLSSLLPNPDDGKVSAQSAQVEGMRDFIALPTSHPFMMRNQVAIDQTIHFLREGHFLRE